MKITRKLIRSGSANKGGLNREQLSILGVSLPRRKGWAGTIIGNEISEEDVDKFIALNPAPPISHIIPETNKRHTKVTQAVPLPDDHDGSGIYLTVSKSMVDLAKTKRGGYRHAQIEMAQEKFGKEWRCAMIDSTVDAKFWNEFCHAVNNSITINGLPGGTNAEPKKDEDKTYQVTASWVREHAFKDGFYDMELLVLIGAGKRDGKNLFSRLYKRKITQYRKELFERKCAEAKQNRSI